MKKYIFKKVYIFIVYSTILITTFGCKTLTVQEKQRKDINNLIKESLACYNEAITELNIADPEWKTKNLSTLSTDASMKLWSVSCAISGYQHQLRFYELVFKEKYPSPLDMGDILKDVENSHKYQK